MEIRNLTQAIRKGDEQAFTRFYDLYSLRLYKHLLVLAKGNETDAQEVLQAIMIKLSKRFETFDEEARLWSWLCCVARNAYVDHYRARQREHRFLSLDEFTAQLAEDDRMESQLSTAMKETLNCLNAEDSELLRSTYIDKRPLQEIAAESGQSYKALESRLSRLRQKVKAHLLKLLRHENRS